MATHDRARLPERPDLSQLKRQARDLQRRTSGLTLAQAQLAVARRHGFASWPRLKHQVDAITARSWVPTGSPAGSAADLLADRACLTYADGDHDQSFDAGRALRAGAGLAPTSFLSDVVSADVAAVRRLLDADPAAAVRPLGPRDWSPLMYLAYARTGATEADVLDTATSLLDTGADPNDGRFFTGLATPFTVLTGVLGGGERDEPAHPHRHALAELLLERGADPNDAQALYNLQFATDDRPLDLLLRHGLGHGSGAPWRLLLPDLLASPRALLRRLLHWAVEHDQRERVALLAAHGVDVSRVSGGASSLELALVTGHPRMADVLRAFGVGEPDLDPVETLVAAALVGDREAVAEVSGAVAAAHRQRPGLLVWAAALGRIEAIDLLVETGFDVNALGRGDVPVEQPWQTALHTAVEHDDPAMVRRLLELGADPDVRDARFDGTALDWADHLGHELIAEILRVAG